MSSVHVSGISADWQIAIEKSDHLDRIVLTAEADAAQDEVRREILSRFSAEMPDAWKSSQKGFFEVDARVVPKNSLRVGRKLLRIADKRKF